MTMPLKDLVDPAMLVRGRGDVAIAGLTADSRQVKPGFLFAALRGANVDGAQFLGPAVRAGAAAVITERPPDGALPDGVAYLHAADARRELALAASRFYPRQPDYVVAVTGTAGKTSVVHFTRQIWRRLGRAAASVGTLGVVGPSDEVYGGLTTPDPVALHRALHELAGDGVTHLALEASSHGLDQRRLDGLRLKAAAFTNLGRDHLDYHADMEAYLAAKLRLFGQVLPPHGTAVVALPEGPRPGLDAVLALAAQRGQAVVTTAAASASAPPEAAIRARIASDNFRQVLTFDPPFSGRSSVTLPLAGHFQAANALLAAGLAIACGEDPGAVVDALADLQGVPGRLELVGRKDGAGVFVDYAHKPEALDAAILALRPLLGSGGRLAVVFGAGGDRDPGKRPLMGRIAAERADIVVVTDDNPRGEDPAAIRAAILQAAPDAVEIGERGEAIDWAIGALRPGDVLLIAGKGHETGQIVGDRTIPFCDREAARESLRRAAAHA